MVLGRSSKLAWIIFFVVVLFIVFYGNIKLEKKKGVDYFNLYVEVGARNNAEIKDKNIFFFSESGRRIGGSLTITNDIGDAKKIRITPEGELGELSWVELGENKLKLEGYESKLVNVFINIPSHAEGNYSGRLRIETI